MSRHAREAQPLEWLRLLPPPSDDLPRHQRDVLIQLALAMKRDGSGWVPSERLQREASVGKSTVTRAVTWAQENGWLDRTSRGHRITGKRAVASTYQLLLPAQANASANDTLGRAANASSNEALAQEPRLQTGRAKASNRGAKASPNDALSGPSTSGPLQVVHDGSLRSLPSDPPLRSGSDDSSKPSGHVINGKRPVGQQTAEHEWLWSDGPEVEAVRQRFRESGISPDELKRRTGLTLLGINRFVCGVGQTSRTALRKIEQSLDDADAA